MTERLHAAPQCGRAGGRALWMAEGATRDGRRGLGLGSPHSAPAPTRRFCLGPLEKVVFSSTAFLCRFHRSPRQPTAFKRFSAGAACERVGSAGRSRQRPLRQPRGCPCSWQHLHTVPRCQAPGPTRKTAQEWVGWLLQQPGAGGPAQARASHKSPGYRGRGLMGRFSRQTPAPTL